MTVQFTRVAVAGPAEAGLRIVRAVRAYNHARGTNIATVALIDEAGRRAGVAREVDEVFELGFPDLGGEPRRIVDEASALERALRRTRADAVWVGWGNGAAYAAADDVCRRLGIVLIGPLRNITRLVQDKVAAKLLAQHAGVPVGAWSGGTVGTMVEARRHARRLGYPLMLKAAAGHGGRAIRRVRDEAELEAVFERLVTDAEAACGEGALFLERVVEGARLIEVEIVGDRYGTVWPVGVRDATVQQNGRKLLVDAPPPGIGTAEEAVIRACAVRLGCAVGYEGAGTVELLFDPATRTATFMELNPGIPAQHAVTEASTGLDVVELQLHVARAGRLEGPPPPVAVGHAIGAQIYVDVAGGASGADLPRVALLRLPSGAGIRADCRVEEGGLVPAAPAEPIATIVAVGRDRAQALARLARAVEETVIVAEGGTTNRGALLGLFERPEVRAGATDVDWLDRLVGEGAAATSCDPRVPDVRSTPDRGTRRRLPLRAVTPRPRSTRPSRSRP